MREIKFRAKSTDDQKWVYGYYTLIKYSDGEASTIRTKYGYLIMVDPETVGQYTGLKDKNGREIYEGDIVVYYNHKTALVEIDLKDMDHHMVYWEEDECGDKHPMQYRETGKVIKYKSTKPVSIDPIFGMDIHLPHRHAWYKHEDNGVLLRVEVIGNIYDNPSLLKVG